MKKSSLAFLTMLLLSAPTIVLAAPHGWACKARSSTAYGVSSGWASIGVAQDVALRQCNAYSYTPCWIVDCRWF